MTELRLLLYEFKRLLQVRKMWLFIAVIILVPIMLSTNLFGLGDLYTGTMTAVFILNPAKNSALIATLVASIMILMEMQRMTKYRMNAIIETATDPLHNYFRQTVAMIMIVTVSFIASVAVLLPYSILSMGRTFKIFTFLMCWIFIYFGGIVVSILLTSGLMMITRNFDLSFIIVSLLIAISVFTPFGRNYLLFWIQTNAILLSDATQSYQQIDIILYTRLVWLLISSAVYVLGLACIRRNGKNLIQALLHSTRKVVFPLLVLLLASGSFHFAYFEPFFDKGPVIKYERKVDPDTGIVIYKTDDDSFQVENRINDEVAFKNGKAVITVDTAQRVLKGEVIYSVRNPSGEEQDVSFTVTPGLDLMEVYENDERIVFEKNKLDNFMSSIYHLKLTTEKSATLRIVYKGAPRSGRDFQSRQWGITDQFVLIPYTIPLPNNGIMEVKCTLNLPERLTPIMENMILKETPSELEGYKTYHYTSSGWEWLIAGDYQIEKIEAGGQEIQFIYLKGKEELIKKNNAVEVVADVVNYFSDTFGPLDFKGMPFIIAELDTSFVSGGWGLGNMSVFGETLFAGTVYKGSAEASNYEGGSGIGVAVHEIAHQWWGWSPDSVYVAEDGQSPWSSEGLTVYSTYLYMKERYGEEYAKKELTDVWERNTKKMRNAFYLTHLEYASKLSENDAADIYTAFASTTRYEMMPYLLLKAQNLVGGEEAFVTALRKINNKYRGKQLFYQGFLNELGISKEDLNID